MLHSSATPQINHVLSSSKVVHVYVPRNNLVGRTQVYSPTYMYPILEVVVYRIQVVCIISPWAISLTSALDKGGLIIRTELIYKIITSVLYQERMSR